MSGPLRIVGAESPSHQREETTFTVMESEQPRAKKSRMCQVCTAVWMVSGVISLLIGIVGLSLAVWNTTRFNTSLETQLDSALRSQLSLHTQLHSGVADALPAATFTLHSMNKRVKRALPLVIAHSTLKDSAFDAATLGGYVDVDGAAYITQKLCDESNFGDEDDDCNTAFGAKFLISKRARVLRTLLEPDVDFTPLMFPMKEPASCPSADVIMAQYHGGRQTFVILRVVVTDELKETVQKYWCTSGTVICNAGQIVCSHEDTPAPNSFAQTYSYAAYV